jgi:hypothetical protein
MTKSAFDVLTDLLKDVRQEKQASKRDNDPRKDPGGHDGPSTHVSAIDKTLDDGLIVASEGSRSAENATDIDKSIPGNAGVAAKQTVSAGEGTPEQDKHQLGIGVNQSSTGGDPKAEDEFKDHHSDPGTTLTITRIDKNEKYSSAIAELRKMPFDKLAEATANLGNKILSDRVKGASAAPAPAPVQAPTPAPAPVIDAEKQARVQQLAENFAKEAAIQADLVIGYLDDQWAKFAGEVPEDAPKEEGPPAEGPPVEAAPAPGPEGGMPPGLAGAIEGAPGMDAPPDAGGPPVAPQEAIHELASALIEMGIDPAELAAVAQQMAQGAQGAPAAPGAPPGGPADEVKMADARALYKLANSVTKYRRSGNFRFEPASTKRARALRATMSSYIAEIVNNTSA